VFPFKFLGRGGGGRTRPVARPTHASIAPLRERKMLGHSHIEQSSRLLGKVIKPTSDNWFAINLKPMLVTTPLAILSALATIVQAQVGPGAVSGNVAVHDPTLCRDKNGKYFLFCAFLVTFGLCFLGFMVFPFKNDSNGSRN